MTAVFDTSVLVALIRPQEAIHDWAVEQLRTCQAYGPVIVCDAAYCEWAVGMQSRREMDETIRRFHLERVSNDDETLFLAGRAFFAYREQHRGREKPTPKKVLPDFMIGAVAAATDASLVTANARDFRRFFPRLHVIEPA